MQTASKLRDTQGRLRQMSCDSFREDPDERLKLYSTIAGAKHGENAGKNGRPSDQWVAVMMKAVQDPWSRIRKLGRESLLQTLIAQAGEDRKAKKLKKACGQKKGNEAKGKGKGKQYALNIVRLLLDKWIRAKNWYEKEGLLLLLRDILTSVPGLEADEGLLVYLLHLVALPSLSDPQLPVSDAAVETTLRVAQMNQSLASFAVDYSMSVLKRACTEGDADAAELLSVSGCLSALAKLLTLRTRLCTTQLLAELRPLLRRLAVHPAASLRQRVAEAWALSSTENFAIILTMLVESASAPSGTDAWWRMAETLLMALQEQLTHYLRFPDDTKVLEPLTRGTIINCLHATLLLSQGEQFEVARMGKQALPLLTQFAVRFTSSLSFLQDLFGRDVERFQQRVLFAFPFLSDLIWFLAIRRHAHAHREHETVQKVVSNCIIPNLARVYNASGPQAEEALLPPQQCKHSLSVILLCTYFSDCLEGPDGETLWNLASNSVAWRAAFSYHENVVQYAPDFTLLLRQRGGSPMKLLSLWCGWIPVVYTHQQCLILEAIKVAIAPPQLLEGRKPFGFAYHSAFTAPTMKAEGEDVPLGYHWLKQHFPSAELVPDGPSLATVNTEGVVDIPEELHSVVYTKLYTHKGMEPSSLNAIRSVMMMECEAARRQETFTVVAMGVVSRLDRVAPDWCCAAQRQCMGPGGLDGTGDRPARSNSCGGCSNWDDSGSEESVEGVSADEEIKDARAMLSAIATNYFNGNKEAFLTAACPSRREDVRKLLDQM
uniref:Uncharacterized protein n=1 Tax=Trypanosoma congolense (strain IL3000) TaxID=1068625 RepID=G0UWS2_TRYCI|nr:conserved hypothetical protein [Trypanosoma congolense IL3000]